MGTRRPNGGASPTRCSLCDSLKAESVGRSVTTKAKTTGGSGAAPVNQSRNARLLRRLTMIGSSLRLASGGPDILAAHECTSFDKRLHVSANVRPPNHVFWFGLLRSLAEKHRSREAQ